MNNQQIQDKLKRHLSFLEQDEDNLSLLVKISNLYLEINDLKSAQIYLDKASAIDRIACLGLQGILYFNQKQFSLARDHFMEALTHEETPALRYNLGFIHFINSNLEEAMEVLSPLLKSDHHSEAKLLMARIAYRQNDLDKAVCLLQEILAHNPNESEALGLLALLHFDKNEDELALAISDRALKLDSENYDARVVHIMNGLITQEATQHEIESLLKINPEDSRLVFALGNLHMSQGNFDLAEITLKKAIHLYPEFYDCYIVLGWCQLLNNRLTEAENSYQTAANFVAELSDAWGGLGLTSALKQDFLQAEQFINKAQNLNANCFLTEIAKTISLNHQNPKKAKAHLVKALRNSQVPISEKLSLIIEEVQDPKHLH